MPFFSRGDISLYLTIIISLTMLGSALLLGLILARQISLTRDIFASERAFYAATTGQEEAYYRMALESKKPGAPVFPADLGPLNVSGDVVYNFTGVTEVATYSGTIARKNGGQICGAMEGQFKGETRRIQIGPDPC